MEKLIEIKFSGTIYEIKKILDFIDNGLSEVKIEKSEECISVFSKPIKNKAFNYKRMLKYNQINGSYVVVFKTKGNISNVDIDTIRTEYKNDCFLSCKSALKNKAAIEYDPNCKGVVVLDSSMLEKAKAFCGKNLEMQVMLRGSSVLKKIRR